MPKTINRTKSFEQIQSEFHRHVRAMSVRAKAKPDAVELARLRDKLKQLEDKFKSQ